jgi:hypothetical protein
MGNANVSEVLTVGSDTPGSSNLNISGGNITARDDSGGNATSNYTNLSSANIGLKL